MLPGFTADTALYKTNRVYRNFGVLSRLTSGGLLLPQQESTSDCQSGCQGILDGCSIFCFYWPWPVSLGCTAACLGAYGLCMWSCSQPPTTYGSSGYGCYEACVQAGGDPSTCQTSCGYQPAPPPACCVFNGDGTCRQRCKSGQQTP
jgi:hypothetical protein